jgi:hypothetical protein
MGAWGTIRKNAGGTRGARVDLRMSRSFPPSSSSSRRLIEMIVRIKLGAG